jgi:hypothetical protein
VHPNQLLLLPRLRNLAGIGVPILTPKAFSMRGGPSSEIPALPFSKLDNAGRETPTAGAVTANREPNPNHPLIFRPDPQ